MMATLSAVAKVASRIIALEKDLPLLLMIRLEMKKGMFKINIG